MKRDVCVNEPDSNLPAVRFRAVFWHGSAISSCETDAIGYLSNSISTAQAPRPHPRAHTKNDSLGLGSPAIPPQFKASVLISKARQEHVCYMN
jgi:hypothetical protein